MNILENLGEYKESKIEKLNVEKEKLEREIESASYIGIKKAYMKLLDSLKLELEIMINL